MPSRPCIDCGRFKPVFSGGRCHTCYATWGAANGVAPEMMPVRCPAQDCSDYVTKRGLCDRHYRRFLDHGSTEKVRQQGRSDEHRHPLYPSWKHLKVSGTLGAEWAAFWTFLECVGERPSPRHRLERPDRTAMYGPENWIWAPPKLAEAHSVKTVEGRRAYQQGLRGQSARYWVGGNLKRYFGLTLDQYDTLLAAQGGGCAVCGRAADVTPKGDPQMLAVDHDHKTMEIRGLLCRDHNMLLGLAADSAECLRTAAAYLDRPRHTGLFAPRPGDERAPRRHGRAEGATGAGCEAPGCDHPTKARGLCQMHYARFLRTGSADLAAKVRPTCTAEGCDREGTARGLCHKHYEVWRRTGDRTSLGLAPGMTCSLPGCEAPVAARGMCKKHYVRWQRRGSPDVVLDTHGRPRPACDSPDPAAMN